MPVNTAAVCQTTCSLGRNGSELIRCIAARIYVGYLGRLRRKGEPCKCKEILRGNYETMFRR